MLAPILRIFVRRQKPDPINRTDKARNDFRAAFAPTLARIDAERRRHGKVNAAIAQQREALHRALAHGRRAGA